MSDLISRQAAIDAFYKHPNGRWTTLDVMNEISKVPSAEPERKRGMWTTQQVAEILANLFGDSCACNFNDIKEWLPNCCEFTDKCPQPGGVICWEQYLKWKGKVDEKQ